MKTSTIIGVIVALIAVGSVYWYVTNENRPGEEAMEHPVGMAGTNGSPNQGNLGGADTGTPQQPGDGTGVADNLILGLNVSTTLGNFLSAYNGMTLYTYAPDASTPGTSACNGQCATNWPPYTVTSASDIHVSAATTGTVSTITRADGSLQVTYNGKPMYFYAKDTKPGDTTGQGVGGVWYVVTP